MEKLNRLAEASGTLKSKTQFQDVEALWKDAEVSCELDFFVL